MSDRKGDSGWAPIILIGFILIWALIQMGKGGF